MGLDELKRRLNGLKERGVVIRPGESLEEMSKLYESYADICVPEDGSRLEDTFRAVAEMLGNL